MTELLKQVLFEVEKLSAQKQDMIATLILDEIAYERRWEETLSRSQDHLAVLAARVRDNIQLQLVRTSDA